MFHAAAPCDGLEIVGVPSVLAIRLDDAGYGIRFGLTEAEDALMRGPVFATLDEALAWIDAADRAREKIALQA